MRKHKYLHLYEAQSEFESAYTNSYVEPWVSYTEETSTVTFNKSSFN